jgi:hypothetical protein
MEYAVFALVVPGILQEISTDDLGIWLRIAVVHAKHRLREDEVRKVLNAFESKREQINERLFGTVKKFKLVHV